MNAFLAEISKMEERIFLIEDTMAFQCTAKDYLSLRTTDSTDIAGLLRGKLRSSPKWIVMGEARGGEALDLLDAWRSDHSGGWL